MTSRCRFLAVTFILVIALAPRLILMTLNLDHRERWFLPDSDGYEVLAQNMLEHHVFSRQTEPPFKPDFLRTPGYPAFLAVVYALGKSRDVAVILVQVVLSALACVFLYFIARKVVTEGWAVAAGVAQALLLSSIVASQYVLSETLFTFLLVIQLWLAFRYLETSRKTHLVLGAIVLGAMTYCRPVSLLWIGPGVILLLLELRHPFRKRLLRVLLATVVFGLILSPWYIRNKVLDGAFFLTTNTGVRLLEFNVAAMEARLEGKSQYAVRKQYLEEMREEFRDHPNEYDTAHERKAYRIEKAKEKILKHPWTYARLHVQSGILLPNVTSFFELVGQTEGHKGTLGVLTREGFVAAVKHYFGDRIWLLAFVAPWILLLGLIYLGAILGVLRWLVRRHWPPLLFFAAFSLYYIVLSAPAGEPRFRNPAMPMMIITAASGFSWVTSAFARKKDKDGVDTKKSEPRNDTENSISERLLLSAE